MGACDEPTCRPCLFSPPPYLALLALGLGVFHSVPGPFRSVKPRCGVVLGSPWRLVFNFDVYFWRGAPAGSGILHSLRPVSLPTFRR